MRSAQDFSVSFVVFFHGPRSGYYVAFAVRIWRGRRVGMISDGLVALEGKTGGAFADPREDREILTVTLPGHGV